MLLLIWIFGGAVLLGCLARSLPSHTWWLVPLAILWMVGIVPVAIFSMYAAHPFSVAIRNAVAATRSYLYVIAIICVPAIIIAVIQALRG